MSLANKLIDRLVSQSVEIERLTVKKNEFVLQVMEKNDRIRELERELRNEKSSDQMLQEAFNDAIQQEG